MIIQFPWGNQEYKCIISICLEETLSYANNYAAWGDYEIKRL